MTDKIVFLTCQRPNPILLDWLIATGSLTAKFEAISKQKLRVLPQFEGRKVLTKDEIQLLNFNQNRPHSAWVREALLYGEPDGEAWVSACSVFPFASLTGNAKKLTRLGKMPIGYVMFGRGGAQLTQRWIDYTPKGWQRVSLYSWQGRKFLISETFLPAFEDDITYKLG